MLCVRVSLCICSCVHVSLPVGCNMKKPVTPWLRNLFSPSRLFPNFEDVTIKFLNSLSCYKKEKKIWGGLKPLKTEILKGLLNFVRLFMKLKILTTCYCERKRSDMIFIPPLAYFSLICRCPPPFARALFSLFSHLWAVVKQTAAALELLSADLLPRVNFLAGWL